MTHQKTLAEIEDSIAHLGRCSSAWWKAAQMLTGKRMAVLLEEMGDRWNPDDGESSDGIDVDQIIQDALKP